MSDEPTVELQGFEHTPGDLVVKPPPGYVLIETKEFKRILHRLLQGMEADSERIAIANDLMDAAIGEWSTPPLLPKTRPSR